MSELLPLHKLAFAPPAAAAPDIGVEGELKWLKLGQLRIDPRYQRSITPSGRATIRAIVEGFDWSKFSPIVVGERPGGVYAIIDGQHRATGALTHGGVRSVPCYVIRGGDEAEAAAFAIINGQVTAITQTQIHRARVMAKVPDALRLEAVCGLGGVRILRNPAPPGYWKIGDTVSIGTLRSCLKKYGQDVLVTALQCITETGEGNPGLVRGDIIQGFCDVLSKSERWLDSGEALFKAIETLGVDGIYRTATKLRIAQGGTGWTCVATTLRGLLERTLDKGRVPTAPKGRKAA